MKSARLKKSVLPGDLRKWPGLDERLILTIASVDCEALTLIASRRAGWVIATLLSSADNTMQLLRTEVS